MIKNHIKKITILTLLLLITVAITTFFYLTKEPVIEYQESKNLIVDEQVDPQNRASLNKLNTTPASTTSTCIPFYSFNSITRESLLSYTFNSITGERCLDNIINKADTKFTIGDEFVIGCENNSENINCDQEGFKILGYTQNVSDPKLSAIITYATTHYVNSSDICGWGNNYVPSCYIFILNNNVIQKSYVWPDSAERDFPDSFKRFDLNNADNNLYGQSFPHLGFVSSVSYEGDNIKFLTRREDGCASFAKETWNLNVKTGLFSLLNSQRISADGC